MEDQNPTILIIHDNTEELNLLTENLQEHGVRCVSAQSGREGLEKADTAEPSLILADSGLPDIESAELLRQLRAGSSSEDVPVIFLGVWDELTGAPQKSEEAAVDYIPKPLQLEEAIFRINMHLTSHRGRQQLNERILQLKKEVDARYKAEDRMRRVWWERFNFLMNVNPACFYTSVPKGNFDITFVSENIEHILGHEAYDFLEFGDFWEKHLHPDEKDAVMAGLEKILETGHDTREYRFLHQNGSYRWLRDDRILTRNDKGEAVEVIGSLTDISEFKRVEEALKKADSELQDCNAEVERVREEAESVRTAREALLSSLDRDLRIPLTELLGRTEQIVERLDRCSSDEIKELMNAMRDSAVTVLSQLKKWETPEDETVV